MKRLCFFVCWIALSCAPSVERQPAAVMTANLQVGPSFRELAKRSADRLQLPFLLGGEDVSALYHEWDDMFHAADDELLLSIFHKIPQREKESIWHFVQDLETKKIAHPKFVENIIKNKTTKAPALLVTE